jgi:hypothetical protein
VSYGIDHYILVGQTPVPVNADPYTPEGLAGLAEWGAWFENPGNRIVAQTRVLGIAWVSTIFLGMDHGFSFVGDPRPPILFETMAFWWHSGGEEQTRCATWLEAEEQHRQMCAHVARPCAVLAWVGRAWAEYWRAARSDWGRAWRDLRGIPPDEWERLSERMTDRDDWSLA